MLWVNPSCAENGNKKKVMATEPLVPLWYQVTSTHAIGHVELISPSPCLPLWRISVRCVISMFRNHTNWKYTYMFQAFQKHLEPLQAQADHVNEIANALQELQVILSHINVNRLEDLNSRWDTDYKRAAARWNHMRRLVFIVSWLWGGGGGVGDGSVGGGGVCGGGCVRWDGVGVGGRGVYGAASGHTHLPHRGSVMGRSILGAKCHTYCQTSDISCTLVGNEVVYYLDVVGV